MKNVTKCIGISILCLTMSIGVISLVHGQAIKPLSGTKGAEAINNGVNQFNQGQLGNALSHFQQALKNNPRSGVAHYNLALTYNRLGKQIEAKKHFNKASEFGRGNTFIQNSRILKQHAGNQKKRR